jgi:uncharacterized membrane protein YgdD (TMEM256/DUF423 family)
MENWFDQRTAGIIGGIIGSILGSTGALIGCSCWICVRKGRKKFIYTIFALAIAASIALLVTGVVAVCVKQPYHVWYLFLLPGFSGTIVFSGLFPVVRKRFIESEMTRMQAKDL